MLANICAAISFLFDRFTGADHDIAGFFRAHSTPTSHRLLLATSEAGSGLWIGIVLFISVLFLTWRRHWYRLTALLLTVPGGLLVNLIIKFLVHRHRPFRLGPVSSWDGYSFPSGHTIGATLLYGMLMIAIVPMLRAWRWRTFATLAGVFVVLLVGFSRIALTVHYFTDVIGALVLGLVWLTLCLTLVYAVRYIRRPIAIS